MKGTVTAEMKGQMKGQMKSVMNKKIRTSLGLCSNHGLISIDFLFGFLLSFAFLIVFFALAYSLTIVEVVQYIAFASSRTYMAADIDMNAQKANAQAKAESLIKGKFAQYMGPSWFAIGSGANLIKTIANDSSVNAKGGPEYFVGVQIPLTIRLLDFRIPFFGRTKATNAGEGFQTQVSSYLIREPTERECLEFNANRATLLMNSTPGAGFNSIPNFLGSYARISDNGC